MRINYGRIAHHQRYKTANNNLVMGLEYNKIVNYIDELPYIVIQKLGEKFYAYCNEKSELTLEQFKLMYNYSLSVVP